MSDKTLQKLVEEKDALKKEYTQLVDSMPAAEASEKLVTQSAKAVDPLQQANENPWVVGDGRRGCCGSQA